MYFKKSIKHKKAKNRDKWTNFMYKYGGKYMI